MIINGKDLYELKPVSPMIDHKEKLHGVSYGLAEVGYDIRVAQDIHYYWNGGNPEIHITDPISGTKKVVYDTFTLASTIESFSMPDFLVGIVHDKSTWAREGVAVQNTVIEVMWKGVLTLEISFQRRNEVHIPAGAGIAQVIFHQVKNPACYNGKYQNQKAEPQEAIWES